MWMDFHVHGRLTKKSDFDIKYFIKVVELAKESGLDGIILSEHFNVKNFYKMYDDIKENFYYDEGHYIIDGIKVFMGLEIDVKNGGHVILASYREDILNIRKKLDEFTEKKNFIELKDLLDLSEEFNCLTIGSHPFRGEHPLAINQEFEQLKRLHALDLNATDIFNKGLDETQKEVLELSKRLKNHVVTGSDSHYPIQLGSVRTSLNHDCSTIEDIKECIKNDKYHIEISKTLDVKVFSAKITKKYLKDKMTIS